MKKIFILKTGSTKGTSIEKCGDFEEWTFNGLGVDSSLVDVIDVQNNCKFPTAGECLGVVATGSHDMVTDKHPWSEKSAEWLSNIVSNSIPTLGICYGHQLLAYALGGDVGYHPKGDESGSVKIYLRDSALNDKLFSNISREFYAHVSHSQTVFKLPDGAVNLAYNEFEPNHAFRYGTNAWGVQFHPEFSADIMRAYIYEDYDKFNRLQEGHAERLLSEITDTCESLSILSKFGEISAGGY